MVPVKSARALERLYWRRPRRRSGKTASELMHCYRRSMQNKGYMSLCGLSFRSHSTNDGSAIRRPPVEFRCQYCDAAERAMRRVQELPPSLNWDREPEETRVQKFMEQFQLIIAQKYGVLVRDIRSASKTKTIVIARMVTMAICREVTKASYPEIGRAFGKRDHSTVINAVKKIEWLCTHDQEFKAEYDRLKQKCEQVVKGSQPPEGDRFVDECMEAGVRK